MYNKHYEGAPDKEWLTKTGYLDVEAGGSFGLWQPQTGTPQISKDCGNALKAVGKDASNLQRALQNWNWFTGHNLVPEVLAAIAIRESGVNPDAVENSGGGRGLMQIDITQHPQFRNNPNLFDPNWSVSTAESLILGEEANLQNGWKFAEPQLGKMELRTYNAGYPKIGKRVDRARMRQLRQSNNLADFDRGTTNGNYVSSILNIADNCF